MCIPAPYHRGRDPIFTLTVVLTSFITTLILYNRSFYSLVNSVATQESNTVHFQKVSIHTLAIWQASGRWGFKKPKCLKVSVESNWKFQKSGGGGVVTKKTFCGRITDLLLNYTMLLVNKVCLESF